MKKILAFILLPLIFAVVGAFSHEVFQRVPQGNWEMIWNNQYLEHNLDSRPIQVLDAEYLNVFVKTESAQTYFCDAVKKLCEKAYQLDHQTFEFVIGISRNFLRLEAPRFDKEEVDIVQIKTAMFETIRYEYYLTASDGSIWHWGWGDNIYEDYLGWSGFGFLGFCIGIACASWLVKQKNYPNK